MLWSVVVADFGRSLHYWNEIRYYPQESYIPVQQQYFVDDDDDDAAVAAVCDEQYVVVVVVVR